MILKRGTKMQIVKTATSLKEVLSGEKLEKLLSQKQENEIYFVTRALTCNVANANGDIFPDEEVKKAYNTFVGKGLFLNHEADDISKAAGKVIGADYIDEDPNDIHVICICKVNKELEPQISKKILYGIISSVSMGCSATTCECSICGKVCESDADYCDHLKHLGHEITTEKGKREIACSINRGLSYNELSLVANPADETANLIQVWAKTNDKEGFKKVASELGMEVPEEKTARHIYNMENMKTVLPTGDAVTEEYLGKVFGSIQGDDVVLTFTEGMDESEKSFVKEYVEGKKEHVFMYFNNMLKENKEKAIEFKNIVAKTIKGDTNITSEVKVIMEHVNKMVDANGDGDEVEEECDEVRIECRNEEVAIKVYKALDKSDFSFVVEEGGGGLVRYKTVVEATVYSESLENTKTKIEEILGKLGINFKNIVEKKAFDIKAKLLEIKAKEIDSAWVVYGSGLSYGVMSQPSMVRVSEVNIKGILEDIGGDGGGYDVYTYVNGVFDNEKEANDLKDKLVSELHDAWENFRNKKKKSEESMKVKEGDIESASKKFKVGDLVMGVQGVDGGSVGTIVKIETNPHNNTEIAYMDEAIVGRQKGAWDTLTSNLIPATQDNLKKHVNVYSWLEELIDKSSDKTASAYTDFTSKYMKENAGSTIGDAAKAWKEQKGGDEEVKEIPTDEKEVKVDDKKEEPKTDKKDEEKKEDSTLTDTVKDIKEDVKTVEKELKNDNVEKAKEELVDVKDDIKILEKQVKDTVVDEKDGKGISDKVKELVKDDETMAVGKDNEKDTKKTAKEAVYVDTNVFYPGWLTHNQFKFLESKGYKMEEGSLVSTTEVVRAKNWGNHQYTIEGFDEKDTKTAEANPLDEAEIYINKNWFTGDTSSKDNAIESVMKQFGLSKTEAESVWEVVNLDMTKEGAKKEIEDGDILDNKIVKDMTDKITHDMINGSFCENEIESELVKLQNTAKEDIRDRIYWNVRRDLDDMNEEKTVEKYIDVFNKNVITAKKETVEPQLLDIIIFPEKGETVESIALALEGMSEMGIQDVEKNADNVVVTVKALTPEIAQESVTKVLEDAGVHITAETKVFKKAEKLVKDIMGDRIVVGDEVTIEGHKGEFKVTDAFEEDGKDLVEVDYDGKKKVFPNNIVKKVVTDTELKASEKSDEKEEEYLKKTWIREHYNSPRYLREYKTHEEQMGKAKMTYDEFLKDQYSRNILPKNPHQTAELKDKKASSSELVETYKGKGILSDTNNLGQLIYFVQDDKEFQFNSIQSAKNYIDNGEKKDKTADNTIRMNDAVCEDGSETKYIVMEVEGDELTIEEEVYPYTEKKVMRDKLVKVAGKKEAAKLYSDDVQGKFSFSLELSEGEGKIEWMKKLQRASKGNLFISDEDKHGDGKDNVVNFYVYAKSLEEAKSVFAGVLNGKEAKVVEAGYSTTDIDVEKAKGMSKGWEVVSASHGISFTDNKWRKDVVSAEIKEGNNTIIFTLKGGDFVEVENTKADKQADSSNDKEVNGYKIKWNDYYKKYQVSHPSGEIPMSEFDKIQDAEEYAKKGSVKQAADPIPPKPDDTSLASGMKWVFNRDSNAWEQKPQGDQTVDVTAKEQITEEDRNETSQFFYSKPYSEILDEEKKDVDDLLERELKSCSAEKHTAILIEGKRWIVAQGKRVVARYDLKDLPKETTAKDVLKKAMNLSFKKKALKGFETDATETYNKLKALGIPMDSHESDLYVKVTPESQEIVDNYVFKDNVKKFKSEKEPVGEMWFDIPFAYAPFWDKKKGEVTAGKKESDEKKEDTRDVYEADSDDLILLIENDQPIYENRLLPAYKNLSKKMQKGTYDKGLAPKLFMYVVDEGAKKWYEGMKQWADDGHSVVIKPSLKVKEKAAKEMARTFEQVYENKEYDFMKEPEKEKEEPKTEDKKASMNTFKVTYEDGNTMVTGFNGTLEDAKKYYEGKVFNVGDGPNDNMVKAVTVEEVKESETKTAETKGEDRMKILKRIVENSQYEKIDGKMVDGFTASMLVQIYDALGDENKQKFSNLPLMKMVDVGWKLTNMDKKAGVLIEEMVGDASKKVVTNVKTSARDKVIKLLTFDELSDEQKKKVIEKNREINVDFDDWAEPAIEGAIEDLSARGYNDAKIYYSGFWSQGDGASFTATLDVAKVLTSIGSEFANKVNEEPAYWTGKITQDGRYVHSNTMSIEVMYEGGGAEMDTMATKIEEVILEDAKAQADSIYKNLESYYEELTGDEAIIEALRSSDSEFNSETLRIESNKKIATKESEIKSLTEKLAGQKENDEMEKEIKKKLQEEHNKRADAEEEIERLSNQLETIKKENEHYKEKNAELDMINKKIVSEIETINFKVAMDKKVSEARKIAEESFEKGLIGIDENWISEQVNKGAKPFEVEAQAIEMCIAKKAKEVRGMDEIKITAYKEMINGFRKTASVSKKAGLLKTPFCGSVEVEPEENIIQAALRSRRGSHC